MAIGALPRPLGGRAVAPRHALHRRAHRPHALDQPALGAFPLSGRAELVRARQLPQGDRRPFLSDDAEELAPVHCGHRPRRGRPRHCDGILLQRRFTGRAVLRSVVLLPWVLPGAITAVLWIWVFNPSWGMLNTWLRDLGLITSSIPWLSDPSLAFASVAVAHIWSQVPFSVVLIMAALSTIDPALFEAARIDGANAWQRFRFVVWPADQGDGRGPPRLQRAHRLHDL
ncbi:MAG: sugar ABC transporter permease [Geminicoccaceae bacterium]